MRPTGTFDKDYGQDMAILRTRFQWIMMLLLLVSVFCIFPLFANDNLLGIANLMGIITIAALGLNILIGYCGLISIGHAAFVGVGAYFSAIFAVHLGLPFWAGIPLAGISTALVGIFFGLPSLRIKGMYLAMSTLAAHFIIIWLIIHGGELTGGVNGLTLPKAQFGDFIFNTETRWYFLIIGLLAIMTYLAKNLVRTRTGRAFIAIRDNDLAAGIMGVDVFKYKLIAFAAGSVYAGIAGGLQAYYYGSITAMQFPLSDSIWYIGYLIVGGMGSITGTILGVVSLKLLSQLVMLGGPTIGQVFPAISGSFASGFLQIALSLVIIMFLVFEPRGLYHRFELMKSSVRIWPFPYPR